jgi:uncharacterized protein YbjT (DUF2867 family)
MAEIFIMGALGNVGLEVAGTLQEMNVPFRAGDLDPEKIMQQLGSDIQAVKFVLGDETTYAPAFSGIKKMFLMRPPQISNVKKYIFPAIDAAIQAGVEHFVFLSLIGIEQNKFVPHYKVEQYLVKLGVTYTFLRASFFMQNLNTTHRAEIRDRSEIYIPAGNSKTSFLDTRDIGQVAAIALTQAGRENNAHDLTGGEALDYYQVAAQMSEELGRKIVYRSPGLFSFVRQKVKEGTPLPYALIMAFLYHNTQKGMAATVNQEVERLTGRKPFSLRQYIRDYREYWQP